MTVLIFLTAISESREWLSHMNHWLKELLVGKSILLIFPFFLSCHGNVIGTYWFLFSWWVQISFSFVIHICSRLFHKLFKVALPLQWKERNLGNFVNSVREQWSVQSSPSSQQRREELEIHVVTHQAYFWHTSDQLTFHCKARLLGFIQCITLILIWFNLLRHFERE